MKKSKLILILPLLFSTVSCKETTESASQQQQQTQKIDYAAEVPLRREYKGKSFRTQGIEQVTLKTPIDGDTAHFYLQDGKTVIKARFFGIDTPESTGKIQPFGKGASNYTKEILKEADANGTIVISSDSLTDGVPEVDSTGSRYVCCVWVNTTKKNASVSERKRLNLRLVQDGWSNVKNVASRGDDIANTFYDAEKQARNLKLNLFSDQPDPLFNYGDYQDVSLLEVKQEIERSLKDPTHENSFAGQNIRFTATVTGYADNTLYLTQFFSKEDGGRYEYGEYAGINFFCGRTAIPSKFTKPGAYLQLCGNATDSETFGFQCSGGTFPVTSKNENDAKVIIKAEDNDDETDTEHYPHTFNLTTSQVEQDSKEESTEYLYSPVAIEDEVQVTSGYVGSDKDITLRLSNNLGAPLSYSVYIPFTYKNKNGANYSSADQFIGKKFKLKGIYSYHQSSGSVNYQIICRNSNDFVEA